MRNMTIKARILFLGLLAVGGVALSGGFGIFQLSRFNSQLEIGMNDIHAGVTTLVDIQSANNAFKTQVQEWKNILIRGNKEGEFEKYKNQFEVEDRYVQKKLNTALDALRAQNEPTNTGAIENIEKLLKDHAELGNTYQIALAKFDRTDPEAGKRVDEAVRGLDRAASEGMSNLASTLTTKETDHLKHQVEASQTAYTDARNLLVGLMVLIFLPTGLMVFLTVRQISVRISSVQQATEDIRKTLDLTRRISVTGTDEMALVANSVDALLGEFHTVVRRMKEAGYHVSTASDELSHSVIQLTSSIEQQNEATSSMAASIEEMAVSVTHVSESSATAKSIAQESLANADQGRLVIDKTAEEMMDMAQSVQATSHTVEELNQRTDEIGSIVNVIKDIADQTNLLALNAAIEAARAGEQGRGFAVVADEVRKLAERTSASTEAIGKLVVSMQSSGRDAVNWMSAVNQQVTSGKRLSETAVGHIDGIRASAQHVVTAVNDISASISEQSSTTQSIAQQVETVARLSETNSLTSKETEAISRDLDHLSASLRQAVNKFHV